MLRAIASFILPIFPSFEKKPEPSVKFSLSPHFQIVMVGVLGAVGAANAREADIRRDSDPARQTNARGQTGKSSTTKR